MTISLNNNIHENDYLTKEEVINILKQKYKINITSRALKFYGTEKLIEPGIKDYFQGFIGILSIYPKQTPLMINHIKKLQEIFKLKLKEISKYRNLGYEFDGLEINNLNKIEYAKFETVITAYACAEVDYIDWFEIKSRNGEVHQPVFYEKRDKNNDIEEIHVKIIEINVLGKSSVTETPIGELPAYKEIIFSKKGVQII
ncbi:MAG: hypothetical protein H8E13_00035 [Actinobacteria bacterium]|nr:hypothetical protein [Actinomycetota bacterium]